MGRSAVDGTVGCCQIWRPAWVLARWVEVTARGPTALPGGCGCRATVGPSARLGCETPLAQPLQLHPRRGAVAAAVVGEAPDADSTVLARVAVEGRVNGGGWADRVHQAHAEERGDGGAGGEVHPVEVGQRGEGRLHLLPAVVAQVAGDLDV